jgi:hypothetical protein
MSLEMAVEAVEAEAVRGQNAKLAALSSSSNFSVTPGPPPSQNGKGVFLSQRFGLACSAELMTALQVAPQHPTTTPIARTALG